MKVIPQTCHSHYISYLRFYFYFTMSVPDEGYSTNTSFALHYISSFLFFTITWFYSHYMIFVSIFILLWAYLMKVIPQTRHSHYIINIFIFLFLFYYERTWWRLFHKHVIRTTLAIRFYFFLLSLYFYFTRLFHKHVIRTTLAIFVSIFILLWAYLMKVIPQTRHSHYIIYLRFYFYFTMSVPDEGYSTNTLFALHYISSFLFLFTMSVPDEGYSTNTSFALHYISSFLFLFYYERTWWRLFHKHVIRTTLYIFVSIFILLWAYLMKVIPQTRHSHYIIYLRFYFYFTMSVPDEGYSTNTSFALHYTSSFLFLFYYERTWWRLFHKHVIRTTLYIFVSIFILLWAYLMKVIPQTRHSHYISYLRFYFYFTMSVPDEGYSTNTSFALHYISSFLFLFYYERTWWRLFHKHVIRTTLAIFVSIFILLWAYLMKVIPQTRHSHYIIYLRFYFYFTMSVPDEGYSTNTSFALHYISSFLFLFYYERTWWRLFHKHVIRTTLYIFVSIFILLWAYLMKVIPQTRHSHYISIFVSIFILLWAYLMKVIPQTRHSHTTSFLFLFYYYLMKVIPQTRHSHYISSFLFLFYYERTWWRLFHKHVIRTTLLRFYFYFTMSVPDEGYSTNTSFITLYIFVSIFILLWAYLMKVIPQTRHSHYIIYLRFYFYFTMSVPDEGYSTNTSFALHYTIFVSIFILLWAYLMKVIPQTRHSHYIIYLRFYFYFTMSVPDEGYSTNTSFALH